MKKLISTLLAICLLAMFVAMSEENALSSGADEDVYVQEIELDIDDLEQGSPEELEELDEFNLSDELLTEFSITDGTVEPATASPNDTEIMVGPESDRESIRFVQEMLTAIRALPEGNVSGVYDEATRAAVKAFQQWVNQQRNELTLEVTGLVDNETRLYLEYCYDHDLVIREDVAISSSNFPDDNFRKYVLSDCDSNHDGFLSASEIEETGGIQVEKYGIVSLQGIEYFTSLKWLDCRSNRLTELDLSGNTKLLYLYCNDNDIEKIDISQNALLIEELQTGGAVRSRDTIWFYNPVNYDESDPYLILDNEMDVFANEKKLCGPDMSIVRKTGTITIGVGEKIWGIHAEEEEWSPYWIELLKKKEYTCSVKSSNKKVAKGVNSGYVKGLKVGTAKITATATDRGGPGTGTQYTLKVKKAPYKVKLSETKMTMRVFENRKLTAKLPSGSASHELKWISSDEEVVSVDEGKLFSYKEGTATITVKTYNGKKATCKVTVTAPEPTTLTLNTTGLYLEVGETFQVIPTIDEGTSTTYSYRSKNKKIASVSSRGLVKGVKRGKTKITVKTKNGLAKTFTVQVGKANTYKSGTSGIRVYASTSDKYFHTKNSCTGIIGSQSRISLETALNYGKQPCALCAASARKTVYIDEGRYYHYNLSHTGAGAKECTLAEALARGYDACPDCGNSQ